MFIYKFKLRTKMSNLERLPNHENSIEIRTPRDAVRWYRTRGQEADLRGSEQTLLSAAQVILENDPDGFLTNLKGKEALDQPYMMDAACMLMEAARLESNTDEKRKKRTIARKALLHLSEESRVPMGVKVDARMYLVDLEFQDLYDDQTEGKYSDDRDYLQFEEAWEKIHVKSIDMYCASQDELENSDTYKIGKMYEWFWIITKRHQQLKDETTDSQYIRSAYLREDRAFTDKREGYSGNFDVALEEYNGRQWEITQRAQLGIGVEKNGKYESGIRVYRHEVNLPGPTLAKWARSLRVDAESIFKDEITLNYVQKNEVNSALEVIS